MRHPKSLRATSGQPAGLYLRLLPAGSTQLLHPWVPGAQMRCKLPVALPLVVLLHFIYRAAGGHTRRLELPCAFGTSPTLEALCFNPHHLSTHCVITSDAIYEERDGNPQVIAPRSFLSKLTRECLSQHVSLHRLHIQHSGKAMMTAGNSGGNAIAGIRRNKGVHNWTDPRLRRR